MPKDRCPICGGWHEPDVHERGNPFDIVGAERIGYSVTSPRKPRGASTAAFAVESVRNPEAERRAELAAAEQRRRSRRRVMHLLAMGLGAAAALAGVWFGRGVFAEWRAGRTLDEAPAFARPEAAAPAAPTPASGAPGRPVPTQSAPGGIGGRAASVVREDPSETARRPQVEVEIFGTPPESTVRRAGGGS